MCTVTIVPCTDGLRLVCNRDERRDRAAALGPTVRRIGSVDATFPVDPQGSGTWIGVNAAGLVAVLLNRTDDPVERRMTSAARFSRGAIIPPLLGSVSLAAALHAAGRVDAAAFDPFRLVLLQHSTCAVVSSDGHALSSNARSFDTPLMFTSSSLGDALVAAPRQTLFEQQVLSGTNVDGWLKGQQRFHQHRWPHQPQISVVMSRADARTVSRTVVDVTSSFVTLQYVPLEEGCAGRVIAVGRVA